MITTSWTLFEFSLDSLGTLHNQHFRTILKKIKNFFGKQDSLWWLKTLQIFTLGSYISKHCPKPIVTLHPYNRGFHQHFLKSEVIIQNLLSVRLHSCQLVSSTFSSASVLLICFFIFVFIQNTPKYIKGLQFTFSSWSQLNSRRLC